MATNELEELLELGGEPEEPTRVDTALWWLQSRKNIVGLVFAVTAVVIHLVAGLGVFWPVVAGAAYGLGALVTPQPPRPVPLPPPPTAAQLRELLERQIQQIRSSYGSDVPEAIDEDLSGARAALVHTLKRWQDLAAQPRERAAVETIITQTIPELTASITAIPPDRRARVVDGVSPNDQIHENLEYLRTGCEKIEQLLIDQDMAGLRAQAEYLRGRFATNALD